MVLSGNLGGNSGRTSFRREETEKWTQIKTRARIVPKFRSGGQSPAMIAPMTSKVVL